MAFAPVQISTVVSASAASLDITLSATGQGNLVVGHVKIASTSVTATSVADNVGNVYVLSSNVDSGASVRAYQFYGVQVTGGATTVTVSFSSSSGAKAAGADEYSGGAATNAAVFDVTTSGSGSSSPTSVSTLTPPLQGN